MAELKRVNTPRPKKPVSKADTDIVAILAKIKGKLVREKIRVIEFLRDYDKHNQNIISRVDFKRGINVCRFDINENELDTLMTV